MLPPAPGPSPSPLEAEIRALRAENHALRASRVAAGERDAAAAHHLQAQARFRAVFEHSPLGQKIIGPDLMIRQANAAVATLLGLDSPLELLGRRIVEFTHPAHRDDWAALQRALWGHHLPSFALETRLVRADGADVWVRVTSVLFPDAGGELGHTTLEDVTDRQRAEAQLQAERHRRDAANRELEAMVEELVVTNEELHVANVDLAHVNEELDTFVYAASHDLRSPIANLQGLLQALAEQLPPDVRAGEHVAPLLGMMDSSVERFRAWLDRLADFGTARQDTAGAREKVLLAAALEEVRADVAPLLAATGGRLEVELAGELTLWFSPPHLHSVLLNLVSNALKYRHPDRDPVVRVRAYRDATRLVVRVKDNGRGLTDGQQGQLFRLFRRFHADVEGTGVGLYLVKKILDHAGGSVRVKSQPGHGTAFTLVFPA